MQIVDAALTDWDPLYKIYKREEVIIPIYSPIWPVLNLERMNGALEWVATTLMSWSYPLKWVVKSINWNDLNGTSFHLISKLWVSNVQHDDYSS